METLVIYRKYDGTEILFTTMSRETYFLASFGKDRNIQNQYIRETVIGLGASISINVSPVLTVKR